MKQLFIRTSKKISSVFKKSASLVMAAGMLASMTLASVPKVGAVSLSAPAARVSFTFDDGISGATTDGSQGDLLAAKTLHNVDPSYKGTAYIITNCVGVTVSATPPTCALNANPDVDYMSWSDIAQLHSTYGWEIGSHTENHPLTAAVDNPSLTDQQLDAEMSGSQAALVAQGYTATDFASPYGDYDNRSLAVTAKYYNSHRAFQDTDPANSYPYNNYLLTTKNVQGDGVTDTTATDPINGDVSVATAEKYVDAAKASNQWLVLVFHNIKSSGASSDPSAYEYNASDLGTIASYVKSQGVTVSDVADGLASGTNLMTNSGFNDGIADGWTTDDATNIKADKQTTSLAGHGSYDGTSTGPLDSVSLAGNANGTATHLLSPMISIDPTQTYTMTNFVNVTSTSGQVSFSVNEFNAAGAEVDNKPITGASMAGSTKANAVQVSDINFLYKPSSTAIVKAQLQVAVQGVGLRGYVDNLQWLSPNGVPAPAPTPVPAPAPTPAPAPGQGGGSSNNPYDNRILVRPDGRAYYVAGGLAHAIGTPAIRDCIAVRHGAGQWFFTSDAVIDGYAASTQAYCNYEQEPGLNFVREDGDPTVWLVHADGTKQHVGSLCVVDAYTTVLKKFHVFVVPQSETAGHQQTADWFATPSACAQLPG